MQKNIDNIENIHNIPKIIHFIWAGGLRTMGKAGQKVIAAWAEKNPKCQIYLWVDRNTPSDILNNAYVSLINEKIITLKYINDLRDIRDDNLGLKIIRYEIEKLDANYGASSDLLRCLISYRYGGGYFDSDVHAGKLSLTESGIFDIDYKEPALYVYENSQNSGLIGNDSFVVTKEHPVMKKLYSGAIENYSTIVETVFKNTPCYSPLTFKREFTISCTGPTHFLNILCPIKNLTKENVLEIKKFNSLNEKKSESKEQYIALKEDCIGNTTPENSWLKLTLQSFEDDSPSCLGCIFHSYESVETKTMKGGIASLLKEIEYTGFLNLDSCIINIHLATTVMPETQQESTENTPLISVPSGVIINDILQEQLLSNLNLTEEIKQKIKYILPVSKYELFQNFYIENFPKIIFNVLHIDQAHKIFTENKKSPEISKNSVKYIVSAINFLELEKVNSSDAEASRLRLYIDEVKQNQAVKINNTDKNTIEIFLKKPISKEIKNNPSSDEEYKY